MKEGGFKQGGTLIYSNKTVKYKKFLSKNKEITRVIFRHKFYNSDI